MGRELGRGIEALAVPPGGGAASRIDCATGLGSPRVNRTSYYSQTAVGVGVNQVKLGGEALAVHQVLRGRVKVHRLQFKGTTPKHCCVASGVVHVDLPAIVAEGCLGTVA